MILIDAQTLVGWIVSGFIGLFFGAISAWVTYRYERKRDDIAWKREKEKLQQQFEHEQNLAALEFQHKVEEQEQLKIEEKNAQIRKDILKGVENPSKTIEEIKSMREKLQAEKMKVETWQTGYAFSFLLLIALGITLIIIAIIGFPQNSLSSAILIGIGIFTAITGVSIRLFSMLLRLINKKKLSGTVEKPEIR